MSRFIDTTGHSSLGIALCGRCSRKFALRDLMDDPNIPGLKVCKDDLDEYDPYRLAPRAEDQVVLPFVRPDENVSLSGNVSPPLLTVSDDGQRFLFEV